MKRIFTLSLIALALFINNQVSAQCYNFVYNYPEGNLTPTTSWQAATAAATYDNWAGDYAYYNVTKGELYEWSLCPEDGATSGFDSELTLWDGTLTNWIAFSDDADGCTDYQAKISWVAPFTGTVAVLISEYGCYSNTTDCVLMYRKSAISSPSANPTQTTCSYDFYDTGGSGGDYSNSQNYYQTFTSTSGECVRGVVNGYSFEEGFDYLYVYDGTDVSGTHLFTMSGPCINGTVDKTGTAFYGQSGSLCFHFWSNGTVTDTGWDIDIDCPDNCQPPSCAGTSAAADDCGAPTPICDFNGYCGDTYSYTADSDTELSGIFCGSIENNSWLSFVASASTAKLDVWVNNCIHGQGIQLQVYSTTDCSTFTAVSNCWSPAVEQHGVVTATGLTPGETYYLMIDGYAGDSCEYTFAPGGGVIATSAGLDQTLCEGESVSFTASGGTNYAWTASPSDPSLTGQESNATINVSPSTTTTYTVTTTSLNPECPGTASASAIVNAANASFTGLDASYCETDGAVTLTPYPVSGSFSGNGVSGSSFDPTAVSTGVTHNITYEYPFNVISLFEDDFSTNLGWTTSSGWSRTTAVYGCPTHPDPQYDASPGNDNYLMGYLVGDCYENSITATRWVTSPVIDCSGAENVHVGFKRWLGVESSSFDHAYIQAFDGMVWNTVWENTTTSFQDDTWDFYSYDVSAYADGNSSFQVRFGMGTTDGSVQYSGWNIDDLSVTGVEYNASGACVSTDVQQTIVYPLPTPSISGDSDVCAGETNVAYSVTNHSGNTYAWVVTGGSVVSGSGTNSITVDWGTGTSGTVSVTETSGSCAGNDVFNVSIHEVPGAAISPNPGELCNGSTLNMSGNVSGGTSPYTHSWTGSGSGYLSSSSIENPVFNGTSNGTFNLTYTVTDAYGCSSTDAASVDVNANPTISLLPGATASACEGGTINLNGNPSGGNGSFTHDWTGDVSYLSASDVVNPTFNATTSGSYSLTYTVTDAAGCTASDNMSVTVNQSPSPSILPDPAEMCTGESLSLDGNPSGGTGTYTTHNWSGDVGGLTSTSTQTPSFSSASAATYNLTYTVTDNSGCQGSDDIVITVNLEDDATFTYPSSTFCVSGADPSPTINTTGGTFTSTPAGLSIDSSTGEIDLSASDVDVTFTVTYTTPDPCSASSSVSITITAAPDAQFSYVTPFCEGGVNPLPSHTTGSDGTYTSTAGLVFVSSNTGEIDLDATTPGSYTITNTIDVTGCSIATETADVLIYDAPDANVTPDPAAACTGIDYLLDGGSTAGDGSITTHAWTGSASYLDDDASETPIFNCPVGSAGTYNLTYTVTDDNGCSGSQTISVLVRESPQINILPVDPTVCSGQDITLNGNPTSSYTVTSNDWTGDVSYLDVTNAATVVFNSDVAASYALTYTVTDEYGCYTSDDVAITVGQSPSVNVTPDPALACAGQDLQLLGGATAGGGAINTHTWSGNIALLDDPDIADPTFNSNSSGTYNLTYTVTDVNGCTASQTIQVDVSESPIAAVTPDPATACENVDLTLSGSGTGGGTTYTYGWSGDVGPLSGAITQQNPVFNASSYGTYNLQLTVTDENGCFDSEMVEVTVYENPEASITPNDGEVCTDIDLQLNGNPAGGNGLYTHAWSGDVSDLSDDAIFNPVFNTASAGTYNIYYQVEDENGCIAVDSLEITAFEAPTVAITPDPGVVCAGTDLQLDGNPQGGSGTYSVHFWDGDNDQLDAANIQTPVFNSQIANTYDLIYIVTDDNNCSASASVTITVNAIPQLVTSSTEANCGQADGTATVAASGATEPYAYLWDNGETTDVISGIAADFYSVTVTDDNGCSETQLVQVLNAGAGTPDVSLIQSIQCYGDATAIVDCDMTGGTEPFTYEWVNSIGTTVSTDTAAQDLPAGFYTVYVTDDALCVVSDTISVSQPELLSAILKPFHISCYGLSDGEALIIPDGGTGNLSYDWEHDNALTADNATGLAAGTYSITVTDNNGCTAVADTAVLQPEELIISVDMVTNVSCFNGDDGEIQISVTGGNDPYDYLWDNNDITATPDDLDADDYIVTVTDDNNCTVVDTITIIEPEILDATDSIVDAMCGGANGTATVLPTGGTEPYTYLWDFSTLAQTTQTAVSLAEGDYSVTITDANDCEYEHDVTVGSVDGGTAIISDTNHISCFGDHDGSLTVLMVGGQEPFTYEWSHSDTVTADSAYNLASGSYTITVTDANGCSAIASTIITEPVQLMINSDIDNVRCYGTSSGSISLTVFFGTQPYTYLWSNNVPTAGSSFQVGLTADTYELTVSDANGCSVQDSFSITEPEELLIDVEVTSDVLCYGGNEASANSVVTGGTQPYTYFWNGELSGDQHEGSASGLYSELITLNVVDSAGCSEIHNFTPLTPTQLQIVDTVITPTGCEGSTDGAIQLSVTGGVPDYTYTWSNGEVTMDNFIENLSAELHHVTVSDANGCETTGSYFVEANPEDCLKIPLALTPNGDGKNDTWDIEYIELYGEISIEIYNRWGDIVYTFNNTGDVYADKDNQFDGRRNGSDLPHASYVFIITFIDEDHLDPITGSVAIIR